jgi:hypothetical protein
MRFWRAETTIFLIIWLLLMIGGRSRFFGDPGALWHIIVGEQILSTGKLPRTDPFSFTFGGKPWIAQWWLGECVLALIHRIRGLDSILLATVTFLACLYTWTAHRQIARGLHPLLAALVTALAGLASTYHFHPRPHLVSIALLGWTFACLCDLEAGRMPLRKLFWLVPVFVFWTNVHGGMVGGVGTMAVTLLGWCFARLLHRDTPITRYEQILPLACLILACGLTAYVNPYGVQMPRAWLSLMFSPVLPGLIAEHRPLMSSYVGFTVLLLAFVYVVALLGVLPGRLRVTWFIPLIWLYLAWTRVRHGPLFAIIAVIALGDMLPHVRWLAWWSRHGSEVCRVRAPRASTNRINFRPALVPVVLVLTAVILQIAAMPIPILGYGWAELDPTYLPLDLLPELQAYERDHPKGTPIFNDMLFGGFLIYYTPGLRVFIDDRCELYGDEGLLEYAHAYFDDPTQIDHWQQQYRFDLALVMADSKFDQHLRNASDWTMLRQTEPATLYQRLPGHGNTAAPRDP